MNRLEIIKKKYPEHYELALKVDDPSGKQKYLLWIAKQLSSGHNATDISQTLKFFHENTSKFKVKDIVKYKDLKDLEDLVKEFGLSNRQIKESDKEGSEKIFEDDNLMVIRVDDKKSMMIYGAGTRWCTTMQDQSYYEDYVYSGNDFYIVIRKKKTSLKSSKYAIVRKGLLEFKVYDAEDNFARLFDQSEEDNLRDAIKAIVSDKPPKNYLYLIATGEVENKEISEWMKLQPEITREYLERKKPELKYLNKTSDELIDFFLRTQNFHYLHNVPYDTLIEMCSKIKDLNSKIHTVLKLSLSAKLKPIDLNVFANDKDPKVRAHVALYGTPEKAEEFLLDNSLIVFKSAARKLSPQLLLSFSDNLKSTRKKKAINEVIIERISQTKVKDFILNQPKDVLQNLME